MTPSRIPPSALTALLVVAVAACSAGDGGQGTATGLGGSSSGSGASAGPGSGAASTSAGGTSGADGGSSPGSGGNPGTSGGSGPGTTGASGPTSDSGSGSDDTGTMNGGPGCPADWATAHPEWIFCDDFESSDPLLGSGRYFEVDDNDGDFVVVDGVGYGGSRGMEGHWQVGEVGAGSLKLGFGRNPNAYMNTGIRTGEDFRELYYRMMVKHQQGWTGSPAKLSRATSFVSASDWSQAMIAHLWSDDAEHLLIDPASCIQGSTVQCVGYNDFAHIQWLGNQAGTTPIFSTADSGMWFCVEAHVLLNDPGQANGVHEFWIDGNLEAHREGLDFVGSYTDYAINAVFFENYWNAGSPQDQKRWFDDIVVSTAPIGCP